MADYLFVTTTEIAASLDSVWGEVSRPDRWATWWPGLVAVTELEPGDDEARGSLQEFTFKSKLPYTLSFRGRITRVDPMTRMDIEAVGELEGLAIYELEDLGGSTRMQLTWTVKTTKTWMNVLAPIARPFFEWNHDVLMKAGVRGLAHKLGTEVTSFSSGHPRRGAIKLGLGVLAVWWLWKRLHADRSS
jgi:Polyketide cyclase / dehydrase and lipid transport